MKFKLGNKCKIDNEREINICMVHVMATLNDRPRATVGDTGLTNIWCILWRNLPLNLKVYKSRDDFWYVINGNLVCH